MNHRDAADALQRCRRIRSEADDYESLDDRLEPSHVAGRDQTFDFRTRCGDEEDEVLGEVERAAQREPFTFARQRANRTAQVFRAVGKMRGDAAVFERRLQIVQGDDAEPCERGGLR